LDLSERSLPGLRQTTGGHTLTGRVTTPNPEALLQGVTSETE